jgi:hypothetical protein
LNNARSIPLLSLFSAWESGPSGSFRAGESVLWKASFDNILGPDRYTVAPSVTLEGGAVLALRERFSSVVVTRVTPTGAIIDIPSDQEFQRDPPLNSEQGLVR